MDGSIPSRASKDAATSRGLRMGEMMEGSAPWSLTASIQKGSRRHIRGSFRTKNRLSPYSSSRIVRACSRNLSAMGEAYHCRLKEFQSHQEDPADSSNSSFSKTIFLDSQCPLSLVGLGFSNVAGKSQPRMFNTRASAEVPLRCIPARRIAILFFCCTDISDPENPYADVLELVQRSCSGRKRASSNTIMSITRGLGLDSGLAVQ